MRLRGGGGDGGATGAESRSSYLEMYMSKKPLKVRNLCPSDNMLLLLWILWLHFQRRRNSLGPDAVDAINVTSRLLYVAQVNPTEEKLARWTTCKLSGEPLQPPCAVDELGSLYNKVYILLNVTRARSSSSLSISNACALPLVNQSGTHVCIALLRTLW